MACIEHYIEDAKNLYDDIVQHHKLAQDNAYKEYCAARTIQKTYRGYVTRKYLKHLHGCATTVQKHWRGFVDRKLYEQRLKDTVHKLFWEYYNNNATKIQKTWRGHYVRTHVFSYYKLKDYIKGFLQMNKEFMEQAREYEELMKLMAIKEMEKECQERFAYLSKRVHHLLRTYQIEGIFSHHGTTELSNIERVLKNVKFMDYMKIKREEEKRKELENPEENYIFEGRMRECERIWHHRNDPGKYSLATGEYKEDEIRHKQLEKLNNAMGVIHEEPMKFGPVRHDDKNTKLDDKPHQCPPLHLYLKNVKS